MANGFYTKGGGGVRVNDHLPPYRYDGQVSESERGMNE